VLWELLPRGVKLQHNRYNTNELESSAYPPYRLLPYRLLRVTRPEQANYEAENKKQEDWSDVRSKVANEFRKPPRRCRNPPPQPLQKVRHRICNTHYSDTHLSAICGGLRFYSSGLVSVRRGHFGMDLLALRYKGIEPVVEIVHEFYYVQVLVYSVE